MGVNALTRSRDFQRVQATGRRGHSDGVVVVAARGSDPGSPSRFGLSIGRSVGGAVTRNRVKRRLRAAWAQAAMPPGYEVVLRGSPAVVRAPFQELVEHLERAVTRATSFGRSA